MAEPLPYSRVIEDGVTAIQFELDRYDIQNHAVADIMDDILESAKRCLGFSPCFDMPFLTDHIDP